MTSTLARWRYLGSEEVLRRSSQALSVIGGHAYIFGGELRPREPRDSAVHMVELQGVLSERNLLTGNGLTTMFPDRMSLNSLPIKLGPSARVGTATTTVGSNVYMYSGRGGTAMAPIDEAGCVWRFATDSQTWSLLHPKDDQASYPQARSYHCSTSDGLSKIFIHAGCPVSGRLSDLWSFDTNKCMWNQLTSAPDPPRGGTSMAYLNGKIYRMGGFDGKHELGGVIDVYDVEIDAWQSIEFVPDGVQGPGHRSVSTLLTLRVNGRSSLITMFGESDPSSLGHEGAGKMLPDAWIWDLENQTWSKVVPRDEAPQPRGWFDADVVVYEESDAIVVQGGLGESNQRLDDLWLGEFAHTD